MGRNGDRLHQCVVAREFPILSTSHAVLRTKSLLSAQSDAIYFGQIRVVVVLAR